MEEYIWTNDADYVVIKTVKYVDSNGTVRNRQTYCPFYRKWVNIRSRVKIYNNTPSCAGVTVAKEWLTFSNFKRWMESQAWEGCELDKDILGNGKREYGPETCCLVPQYINLLLVYKEELKGVYPRGVHYATRDPRMHRERSKPYTAAVSVYGKSKNLGYYLTPEEVHKAWQVAKSSYIQKCVARWAIEPSFNTRVADSLIKRSWDLLLDHSNNKETLKL